MKNMSLLGLVLMTTHARADAPLMIVERGPYALEMKVEADGQTVCEETLSVEDGRGTFYPTGCLLNLAGITNLKLTGTFKGDNASGRFDATYILFDVSPWTGVLRDTSLDFGTRLERYREGLVKLDPDIADAFKIRRPDLPETDVVRVVREELGATLPSELEAFITRDVSIGDNTFIGPAFQMRWPNLPWSWPTITERELKMGLPPEALPAEGTDLRGWYDSARVVFEYVGDGIAPIVWDPDATADQPGFYWLHEDDRDVTPFLYHDGSPVSAQDALLAPIDLGWNWYDGEGWVYNAISEGGLNADDPNLIVVDTVNTTGLLSLEFDQDGRVPLFRTVKPQVTFLNQTWWER